MITCPRTGTQYPQEYFTALKTCIRCGGLINTRAEGWRGDPDGRNPFHANACPPATVVQVTRAQAAITTAATTTVMKTGAEIIAAMGAFQDTVHKANVERLAAIERTGCSSDHNHDATDPGCGWWEAHNG